MSDHFLREPMQISQDYFEEGLADADVMKALCLPEFSVSLASIDQKQEQVRPFPVYRVCKIFVRRD